MKATIKVLLLTSMILISACYPKPEGFIGLKDIENPEVSITNLQNGDTVSNIMENLIITVEAYDFFEINRVRLYLNDETYSINDGLYDFIIETSALLDTNYVYARAYDSSNNITDTVTITFYLENTIIVVEPIGDIDMLDNDNPMTSDLDNVFEDSINPNSQLMYELLSNSNEMIADVILDENILTISPYRYRNGTSLITISITAGDFRTLNYKFTLNVELSEPLIKAYVPDDEFRSVLFVNYDFTEFTGEDSIVVEEAESITNLELTLNDIYSVEGIQTFVNLDSLYIKEPIDFLNLSTNLSLLALRLSETNLSSLEVHALSNLESLWLEDNINLFDIDVSNNNLLNRLIITSAFHQLDFSNLDLSNNSYLALLSLYNVNLTEIDVSNNYLLDYITLGKCGDLEEIIFPTTSCMTYLAISNAYSLESIDVTNLTILTNLYARWTALNSLDISNNIQLQYIDIRNNDDLTETYVWELPLPDNVTLYKDDHNILYVP